MSESESHNNEDEEDPSDYEDEDSNHAQADSTRIGSGFHHSNDESEGEDHCIDVDSEEMIPEPDSTTDVKQRVILALEEFSNTILRKVVELENKERVWIWT